jgi:hypothetical protein
VIRKMTWTSPHAAGVVASPEHGLFVWTPLAVLAVAGLVWLAFRRRRAADPHEDRRPGALLLLMFTLQVYVSGSVESWTVAGAFGQRRFVGATILLVIGLAALRAALPRGAPRVALAAAAAVAIWWNVGLIALFATRMMDRQRLELRRNAYDVFVTLPAAAPGLAARYFTDRESFYAPR